VEIFGGLPKGLIARWKIGSIDNENNALQVLRIAYGVEGMMAEFPMPWCVDEKELLAYSV
jgi:hypothetical protein